MVATAKNLVASCDVWETLQNTGIATPLGEVVVLKAGAAAKVVLAGPSKNAEVKQVLQLLTGLGAECILIDGAFDRQSSADPLVSNQVILASGATLTRNLEEMITLTKCRVEQLTLPVCAKPYHEMVKNSNSKVVLLRGKTLEEAKTATSLLSKGEWLGLLNRGCSALFVQGAVGESLGEALLEIQPAPLVIALDGSKIFIGAGLWKMLKAKKIEFQVKQPINLLGITVNPTFPGGIGLDPDALLQAMGKALYPLPVVDVMREIRF